MFKLRFMCKKAMSKPRYIKTALPVQKGTKFTLRAHKDSPSKPAKPKVVVTTASVLSRVRGKAVG